MFIYTILPILYQYIYPLLSYYRPTVMDFVEGGVVCLLLHNQSKYGL